jgi:hypothetical protein
VSPLSATFSRVTQRPGGAHTAPPTSRRLHVLIGNATVALRFGKQGGGIVRQRENDRAPGFLSLEGPSSGPSCRVKRPVGMSFTVVTTRVTASGSGEIIRPAALVRGGHHHHVNDCGHDRREAIFTLRLASA